MLMIVLALLCSDTQAQAAPDDTPRYELSVKIDMQAGRILGTARIALPVEREILVRTDWITPIRISVDHKELGDFKGDTVRAKGSVYIEYTAAFPNDGPDGTSPQNAGVIAGGAITPDGASLTAGWYPQIINAGNIYYTLSATVPQGFTAVSEADRIGTQEGPVNIKHSFEFPYPRAGVSLAAARYEVHSGRVGDVEVLAYVMPEDASLAEPYIQSAGQFIERYSALLGPYPYKRFAVVQNFLQSGYSMPTFTLIGGSVMRLPFIRETSLGHEVLHQWLGNYVYAREEGGGWVEGLVTYLADHQYETDKSEGWRYRRSVLTDYEAYVRPDNDIPLAEFRERKDYATRAVGYGKAAMVFHMLKAHIGDDAFLGMLKGLVLNWKLRPASWDDIRQLAEKSWGDGRDLRWFFDQWVGRKGVPELEIGDMRVIYRKGAVPTIEFDVHQGSGGEIYRLRIPVVITTEGGVRISRLIEVQKAREHIALPVSSDMPVDISLDPDYDVMRRLSPGEYAPVIARLAGDARKILVLPAGVDDKADNKYDPLKRTLTEAGFEVRQDSEIKDEDVRGSSLLLADASGPTAMRLFARSPMKGYAPDEIAIEVFDHPIAPDEHVVAVIGGNITAEGISAISGKLLHYGRYTSLVFKDGMNKSKTMAALQRGLLVGLTDQVVGVRPDSAKGLGQIINDIKQRPVLYVGEGHTNYEDHRVQLEVIRRLHEEGRPLAIGMEMFQTPYQTPLDDYISGKTDEPDFLRGTEYFKRWGYDYNLYREVLFYARAHDIPVVALNVKREIITKVSSGGLDALSPEERKLLPPDMDMSDAGYRARLKEIYDMHREQGSGSQSFENFYQSQVIWDEVMAASLAEYMSLNPERQMVVLCGQGHVEFGSGLPRRAYRRNGKPYAILINAARETMDTGMADYVIFARPVNPPFTARLMVYLKEAPQGGEGLEVTDFPQDSISQQAGMQKKDVIISIDGQQLKSVDDLKMALLDKMPDDKVRIKLLRKRFLFGPEEVEIEVTF